MPSQTYTSTGAWQKFNVPKGVDRVTVDVKGAGSGPAHGGRVQGQIHVKGDDVLFLLVGEAGKAASGRNGGDSAVGGGGAGGDGASGRTGGRGGGGASAVRLNSTDGTIKAVAGGAGGRSGDGGDGGEGGGSVGGHGSLGPTGSAAVGNATGGSQSQGGNGGSSSADHGLDGNNAPNPTLSRGGHGGQLTGQNTHGGGGGGGGYRAGGGGAAALIGVAPGGGGGGGSNYTGGLFTGVSSEQGGGPTSDGVITVSWVTPPPANQPPGSPSEVKVNGKNESDAMTTRSMGRVTISAIVRDSDSTTQAPTHVGGASTQVHQRVRLHVRFSAHSSFANSSIQRSPLVESGKRAEVELTGLSPNTHYYARLYAEDSKGLNSQNYNSVNFWTNRPPNDPVLQSPGDNVTVLDTDTVTFDWTPKDPDDGDSQTAFEVRWKPSDSSTWVTHRKDTSESLFSVDPGTFKSGLAYDWSARTRDEQHVWGTFAAPRSFFALGSLNPPKLLAPIRDVAVDATVEQVLSWKFSDPSPGQAQTKADYRFRVVGTTDWVTVLGDATVPGSDQTWLVSPDTFAPNQHYEWQVRTYHTSGVLPSDWSTSATFWAHGGIGLVPPVSFAAAEDQGNLGCGSHRVFIYDRGGRVLRGEVTPLSSVQWTRNRDDLGGATIVTNGFGDDCGALLSTVHTWMNELVIYRDGERVMEGPVTLIEDSVDGFKIECKDVMGYVYRRIMRQGYNDSYHLVNGVQEGLLTVVQRAGLLIANALVRNDPNVLPYLTMLEYEDDARESRVQLDYSRTAWEEVDDLAANAGLDYSTIGRRIILNDTHRPIGRLPEFRSDFFNDPPKITEYGMLLADYYAVTDNAGLFGAVQHADSPYGGVEILVSSFNDNSDAKASVMTRAQIDAQRKILVEQAKRGIASRYPAPLTVRVPDNSQLSPDIPIGINQLVPGVWIPLRAQGTVLEISQWQKLDQVQVTEAKGDEQVRVTMSPAPNRGEDPDAVTSAQEAAT